MHNIVPTTNTTDILFFLSLLKKEGQKGVSV